MATAPAPATRPEVEIEVPSIGPIPEGFLLRGISWKTYESLLRDFEESGSNVRMTYDRGILELMSPASRHERRKKRLARMIETMSEDLNIPIEFAGSTTFRSIIQARGLEPDECYWIANEPAVRGQDDITLDNAPPPDLAIEVENTRQMVDRLGVYAALGFPEIWRVDDGGIRVGRLGTDGSYRWGESSGVFPFLPLAEFERFLNPKPQHDLNRWVREFRAWVRETLAPEHARPDEAPED